MEFNRREALLMGAGLSSTLLGFSGAAQAQSAGSAPKRAGPFLTNDVGKLKRVLVHTITPEDYVVESLSPGVLPNFDSDMADVAREHRGLIELLKASGAEVIELADELQAAIERAREDGVFEAWLSAAHPRLAAGHASLTASKMLARDPSMQFAQGPDGAYQHRVDDQNSTMWTRDSSSMTPNGLVICNALSPRRLRENMLLRFVYRYGPTMSAYPIVFDAVEEGIVIEGGDAHVVDAKTLYLGVGNRTDPRAAPLLAQRLNMDVLAVHTRQSDYLNRATAGSWQEDPLGELRILFLHLDTCFTHVSPGHGLVVPWLFEARHAGKDPLSAYIRGARTQTRLSEDNAEKALAYLKEMGTLSLYRAGSGREDKGVKDMKFVDYLRARRYRLTYVGGQAPADGPEGFRHMMSVAMPEFRRQASNVVATAAGEVIAYDASPVTRAALEADGVKVSTFRGRELWNWHGGPHCLTMPIERG